MDTPRRRTTLNAYLGPLRRPGGPSPDGSVKTPAHYRTARGAPPPPPRAKANSSESQLADRPTTPHPAQHSLPSVRPKLIGVNGDFAHLNGGSALPTSPMRSGTPVPKIRSINAFLTPRLLSRGAERGAARFYAEPDGAFKDLRSVMVRRKSGSETVLARQRNPGGSNSRAPRAAPERFPPWAPAQTDPVRRLSRTSPSPRSCASAILYVYLAESRPGAKMLDGVAPTQPSSPDHPDRSPELSRRSLELGGFDLLSAPLAANRSKGSGRRDPATAAQWTESDFRPNTYRRTHPNTPTANGRRPQGTREQSAAGFRARRKGTSVGGCRAASCSRPSSRSNP